MPDMSPDRGKVLAISHACIRTVNRGVYRALKRRGVDIELLLPTGIEKNGEWIEAEPVEPDDPVIHFRPMLGRHGRLFRFPSLEEILERTNPKSVLVEADTASFLTLAVAKWCRRRGRNLICRTAGNLSWRIDEAIARVGWRELPHATINSIMNQRVKRQVKVVCTTSTEATELFRRLGFKNAIFVPMGTDREIFRYRSRDRRNTRSALGISEAETVVSYFGRMVPEKGVDTLVRALGRLKDVRWRLLLNEFEGTTGYVAAIKELIAEVGIGGRVVWAPSRHGTIAKLMTASDVAVLPSRSTPNWAEQYGRVVPEAMACGNLVVVSDSGAPKELVGDSGFVFPEGSHEALAGLLRDISAAPVECLRRRRQAIRYAHSNLSIDAEAAIYERLVAQCGR